jgi:hypothetical protein
VSQLQPPNVDPANGASTVSEAEVARAMAAAKPGTAPGPDGLPLLVYKRFSQLLTPVLARVFSAVGSLRVVPAGFLGGAISALPKPHADPLDVAGYRPITLLNTDYRLLARVLAGRLQPVLQKVVSQSQTAYLRGRRSGSNVLVLQLLLEGLPADSQLVAVLLDFAKAYDTIDRPFLLQCMRALGVGDEFVSWVQTLLSDTSACVVMNGYQSVSRPFMAGVRQGCPLSPLLYLCVAEALARFLQVRGVGVSVRGVQLTSTQFADDTQVLLPSPAHVPAFLAHMRTFGAASGQRLNVNKSRVLLVGRAARMQAAALQRQQQHQPGDSPEYVVSATVLGVPVGRADTTCGRGVCCF